MLADKQEGVDVKTNDSRDSDTPTMSQCASQIRNS
jgi:hypothetical protein